MRDLFLKKHGIKVYNELTDNQKTIIVNQVAGKILGSFASIKPDFCDLHYSLSTAKMYSAEIPNDVSSVIYSYKEDALYFSNRLNLYEINDDMIHECIHKIQYDTVSKMGSCNIRTGKGLMLNEAAIQYITNRVLSNQKNYIQKSGIMMNTCAKNKFTIITNLMEEIVLLVGEAELVNGTLISDGSFEAHLKGCFGTENFVKIRDNFDKIMRLKFETNKFNQPQNDKKIKKLYEETQKIIYENYYDFNKMYDLEESKQKLNLLKEKFENTEVYEDFLMFYIQKINEIKIEEKKFTGLIVIEENKVRRFLNKFRILSKLLQVGYEKNSD